MTMVGNDGVELRVLLAGAPESLNGLTGDEVGEEAVAVNGNKVDVGGDPCQLFLTLRRVDRGRKKGHHPVGA